jgi:hypothetical protein
VAERLIFVSCGQLRPEEKRLGQRITSEIDAVPGFKAYFADTVQDLSGLSAHILDALRRSSGAVVVLHPRGEIRADDGRILGIRSSVWINQEVALLAYRQFFEKRPIPILAFRDPSVTLEGAMTAFIINPKPLVDEDTVLAEVRRWLAAEAPGGATDENNVFQTKWDALKADDRAILTALIAEGGRDIKEQSVRRRLIQHHGFEKSRASEVLRTRQTVLSEANLVQLRHNVYDGDEMSLHPYWEWYVRHAVTLAAPDLHGA